MQRPLSSPRVAPTVTAAQQWERVLRAAAADGASDIHCEPKEDGVLIRFRVDGETRDHASLGLAERDAFLARGKIFAGMDITEKRLPQDGRAAFEAEGRRLHIRASTLPTVHGESLVFRLLDQTMPNQSLEQLGLTPEEADAVREALRGPAGLHYITGPTGSGKSTTLHATLRVFDAGKRVLHALEDPVEYEVRAIRQTEIRERIGLTFASALRALLRQNPDVILVGETRDAETAQLAIRAALTGHTVLSTLHTNDALSAIPRLRDLGIESFLLAASLRLVAAQRLVRMLCPACRSRHPDNARLRERHQAKDGNFMRAVGCPACRQRGYRGRVAIHEVIPMGRFLSLIAADAPAEELAALRDRLAIPTLRSRGVAAAATGLTTLEEIERVL
ncbi:MAG: type II/IV secretion system protein [Candidatus Didemnitutus sp.]|nr:type II/IV secretion system protein [Candidatus Didemnitutus sp.]